MDTDMDILVVEVAIMDMDILVMEDTDMVAVEDAVDILMEDTDMDAVEDAVLDMDMAAMDPKEEVAKEED